MHSRRHFNQLLLRNRSLYRPVDISFCLSNVLLTYAYFSSAISPSCSQFFYKFPLVTLNLCSPAAALSTPCYRSVRSSSIPYGRLLSLGVRQSSLLYLIRRSVGRGPNTLTDRRSECVWLRFTRTAEGICLAEIYTDNRGHVKSSRYAKSCKNSACI